MSKSGRDKLIAVLSIVAVIVAGGVIYKVWAANQIQVVKSVDLPVG